MIVIFASEMYVFTDSVVELLYLRVQTAREFDMSFVQIIVSSFADSPNESPFRTSCWCSVYTFRLLSTVYELFAIEHL
jgi:hypothetical protein